LAISNWQLAIRKKLIETYRNLLKFIVLLFISGYMQNKNEQLIFKGKEIKEEVSLPHLNPPPPRGRGRK